MALVERCVLHLVSAPLPVQGQKQSAGPTNRPGLMGRADPGPSWTPSASSPVTLLEQARQARQLNDALDNFGASRQIGQRAHMNDMLLYPIMIWLCCCWQIAGRLPAMLIMIINWENRRTDTTGHSVNLVQPCKTACSAGMHERFAVHAHKPVLLVYHTSHQLQLAMQAALLPRASLSM